MKNKDKFIYGIDNKGNIGRIDGRALNQDELFNSLTSRLYNTPDPAYVLTVAKEIGVPMLGGKLISPDIGRLQNELKVLEQLSLWKIYTETLKDQAQRLMFNESKCFEDMRAGKMLLHGLSLIDKINKTIQQSPTPTTIPRKTPVEFKKGK